MIIFKIIFRWTSSPNTWFVIDPNWFPIPKNVLRTSTSKWLRPKMLIIVINAPLSPMSNLDISNVLDPTARKCGPGKKSILVLSFHGKFWNIFFFILKFFRFTQFISGLPKPDSLHVDPEEKWFSNPLSTKENWTLNSSVKKYQNLLGLMLDSKIIIFEFFIMFLQVWKLNEL